MAQKKLLLIFNPQSGTQDFALNLYEVVDKFTKSGYLVTAYPTQGRKDAFDMILERGNDYDCLVCSGGDGTLNEAIDALMQMEKRPLFGYLPSGTTNDFAASIGLPRDTLDAVGVVTDGEPHPLDIGRFGDDEHFSYVAAFGLFTDVSYGTPQGMKNRLGHFAYLLEGVKRLGSIESYHCTVDLGEEQLTGDYIFGMVGNSLSVGGFRFSSNQVRMDDGLFEVILIQRPTSFIDLQNVIASLLNQELYTDSIITRRASSMKIRADAPLAWTLDGEFGGEFTDVEIFNCHNAIEIMMPKTEEPQ